MVFFRYMVTDVDNSISFYIKTFGFKLEKQFPAIGIVSKGDLTLWLAGPLSSAAQPMPDGQKPQPGGWNRFVMQVEDLESSVKELKSKGVSFKNEIVKGPGGQQILCVDPSGNVIELFQPAADSI